MVFLTDFGFTQFITSTLIKLIYLLVVAFTVIWYVIALIACTVSFGVLGFFGWLIIGSVLSLISLCIWRVWLECLVLLFRIYEDVHVIAGNPPASIGVLQA
jgi:hypothetical protein